MAMAKKTLSLRAKILLWLVGPRTTVLTIFSLLNQLPVIFLLLISWKLLT